MNMNFPSYWQQRPVYPLDDALRKAFDDLLDRAQEQGADVPLEYTLGAPKWVFLCYAAEQRGLALHGSTNPQISLFEPRQPHDLNEFGAQMAVYAAADGIWPMYFAIVDRARYPTTLNNACIRVETGAGNLSDPYYLFSLGRTALKQYPYCRGFVYLLPRDSFVTEPPIPFGEIAIHSAQLASPVPVKPRAKLAVEPEDFPFLSKMLAHDDERLEVYAQAIRTLQPWPE
jgi:hypothetical protein